MYINPRDLAEEFDIPPFHLLHNPLPFVTMPAARRTRSGRAAPSAPTKRIRTKGGCLTCRIRRKKCDESREHLNGGCETCARLHIECLGYANKRPEWLKGAQVDDYKRRIKHFLADHNAKSASRGQDDAFLTLHDLRESPLPPRQHSESVHSDSDSDSLSDLSSVPDVKQPELSPLYIPQESVAEMPVWPYWGNQDSTPVDPYPMMPTPYGYYDDVEASPVTEEYSYGLHSGYPEAALLSDSMPNNSEPYAFDQIGDEGIQVLLGSYEHPSTELVSPIRDEMIWAAFLQNVERLHLNKHHPDTAAAIVEVLLSQTGGNDLSQRQHMAMQHLLRSRYTPSDARAVTATWMMIDSLRQGTPNHWCEYLDIILHGYFDEILRASVSSSSLFSVLGDAESTVVRHGLWSDLVASATTRRPPCQIDLYRKVLPSTDVELLGFPNKVALAFAETAALAARPELIPQARPNLARYRADLEAPCKDAKGVIHAAGVRLYLETVASRGSTDSALVKDAVKEFCQLVNSAKGPRRGFAFWIFLAGCHAVEDWSACRQLMDELKTGEEDRAIGVASDIMDEAHRARQQGSKSSDFCWTEQLRRRGTIVL